MGCAWARMVAAVVAALLVTTMAGGVAQAQRVGGPRMTYNPVTGLPEPDSRYHGKQPPGPVASAPVNRAQFESSAVEAGDVEPAGYYAPCDCGDDYCGGCAVGIGCGDVACDDIACGEPIGISNSPVAGRWYTGFEATFVKPHLENNTAFTVAESDGASSTSISTTNFDYDLEFSPRVFVGWRQCSDIGVRATWWHFDHSAATASASPPANGFGSITPPEFADVDISSTIPTDVFTASTDLNAYAIDLEATKMATFCGWQLGMGWGVRYAYVEQGYLGRLSDDEGTLRGEIDYRQSIEGFGPTVSVEAFRPHAARSGIFCKARGSLLFGDSKTRMVAGEDLDLSTQFETTSVTACDDLLSIGELQIGYRWRAAPVNCRPYQPFYTIAMEGQVWDGAGSASSRDGALGFFGFNSAVGIDW